MKVKKRFGYPPDLEETPLVNFFKLRNSMLLMLTRNLEGQEELITQLWQKAIFKLGKIQCSVCNKYVTKKKEIFGIFCFLFFLQKIKTHSQILGEKLETVTSETLKIKTQ